MSQLEEENEDGDGRGEGNGEAVVGRTSLARPAPLSAKEKPEAALPHFPCHILIPQTDLPEGDGGGGEEGWALSCEAAKGEGREGRRGGGWGAVAEGIGNEAECFMGRLRRTLSHPRLYLLSSPLPPLLSLPHLSSLSVTTISHSAVFNVHSLLIRSPSPIRP